MPETLNVPRTLNDRYAIERELGRWRISTVYLGREIEGGRAVQIHVLGPEVGPEGGEHFLRQLPIIARLRHPNILPVIDFGRVARSPGRADVLYYVTPFLEVEELILRLQRDRQFPLDDALRIVTGVAAALDYLHERRVVHGALSPLSIALHQGTAIVTDLAETAIRDWNATRVGPEGMPLASGVAYMSPERLATAPVAASDQYSLAAILYEMLAGQPPFGGRTPREVAEQIVAEPPRSLAALRVVPRIIERAVYRGLAKSPTDRFRSAGELAGALSAATATPGAIPDTSQSAARGAGRRRMKAVAIGAAAIAAVVALVAAASRVVVNRQPDDAGAAHRQLTFTGMAAAPVFSPDGQSVLYIAGGRALILHPLAVGEPRVLIPPRAARSITSARWTADGRTIVATMATDSASRPGTYVVPVDDPSSARRVLDGVRPFDTGADSSLIVRAPRQSARLEIVSLVSGRAARTIELPDSIVSISELAWSPDRRWIAFTDGIDALWVINANGGQPVRIAEFSRRLRWSPQSDAIYFLRGPLGAVELMRIAIDRQSGAAATAATRVTPLLAADAFDVGPGNRLVHTQTTRDLPLRTFAINARTRDVTSEAPLATGAARARTAVVSPDGRRIALGTVEGAERDIQVLAFAGGAPTVLAKTPADEGYPAWSPDGARLAFAREDSAQRRVVIADARTGAQQQRASSIPGPALGTSPRWSASGRHVAYFATDLRRIVLVNFQRRTETVVDVPDSIGTGQVVIPSPNGTQLLVSSRRGADDQLALWLVTNNRRWRQLRGGAGDGLPLTWQRNSWIYVVRDRSIATEHGAARVELWRMRGPLGRAEMYAPLPTGCGTAVSISADAARGVCDFVRVQSDLYVAGTLGQ